MEALSGVASGMAVASLVIQLVQSVRTIKMFIRDVKDASKELERLVELLDRLGALLDDVRNLMERQTSLQGQHFPAPSMTIFNCLKSCEASLESLHSIIEKYMKSQNVNVSAMSKLKDDIKFGFKKKEIVDFEARIQREIEHLQASLNINSTDILMSVFPSLLQNQQACMTMCSQIAQQPTFAQAPAISINNQELYCPSREATKLKTFRRQFKVSSTLEWVGIYQQKSVHYVRHEGNKMCDRRNTTNDTISTSYDVILDWRLLRYGFHWARQYRYGCIVPSLSMYPVVENLYNLYQDLFGNAPLREIQEKFNSGALHPFTRDTNGMSLLHIAAIHSRVDVCRLLVQYGLRPSLNQFQLSPLCYSLASSRSLYQSDRIDTARLFLLDCEQVDDFENEEIMRVYSTYYFYSLDLPEWLWKNSVIVLNEGELLRFRYMLLQNLVQGYRTQHNFLDTDIDQITERIVKFMNTDMIKHYLQGDFGLLNVLWWGFSSLDSQRVGGAFIDLLKRLGVDVEACINMELESLPGNLLNDDRPWYMHQKIVFEPLADRDWLLKWVWVFDPCEPGHLLVSEHIGLGPDTWDSSEWPFCGFSWDKENDDKIDKSNTRFNRRMAIKARKERARTGQKRAKSRMPGAWDW